MRDLISVIIPVYKTELYLRRCLDSVINQTYTNLEIIIVDDGSPDNSGKICDEYALKDKRIKVIHKENGGLSSARNAGIDIATGKYIGFVDSDDEISIYMYEILYKEIIKNKGDIVVCNYTRYKNTPSYSTNNYKIKIYNNTEAILGLIANKHRKIDDYAWNKLYKTKLFKKIKFPLNRVYEDIGTTYLLIFYSKKVITIDAKLYGYFINLNSISNLTDKNYILDRICSYEERYNFLIKRLEEYKNLIKVNRIISLTGNFMWLTHIKDKNLLYSKEFNEYYKIIKNTNYILLFSYYKIPKKYLIEFTLLKLNRDLFFWVNIFIQKIKSLFYKLIKEYKQ